MTIRGKYISCLRSTTFLAGSGLLSMVLLAVPAIAIPDPGCPGETCRQGHGQLPGGTLPARNGSKQERSAHTPDSPFVISVEDGTAEHSPPPIAEKRREGGQAPGLADIDIRIKFDGLSDHRLLNVATARRHYRAGETVGFLTTSNYADFISRAEILIYGAGKGRQDREPVAVIPVQPGGEAEWVMPAPGGQPGDTGEYRYVLRVHDARNRFDETAPRKLPRGSTAAKPGNTSATPGMAEDNTAIRNIPAYGGVVTVYGRDLPPGHRVKVFGDTVPLDPERGFVVQRLLPPGKHEVKVSVSDPARSRHLHINRDIDIPDQEWFHVALADLTIGKRTGDPGIEAVRPGEYDPTWSKGRLALYLKGKIKGKYLLTAAADTGERETGDLLGDLGGRNSTGPRGFLRRLDPDAYYPVYGDDSTFAEDAPTDGKFYVRLERDESHLLWGNYKTSITGTELLPVKRRLYGANGVYRGQEQTSFGVRRSEVMLYAAQPDTLPRIDEFQGSGGSAYFLKRQNIVPGSETLEIELRDRISGRVISRRSLNFGEDYAINYIQGIVILNKPLLSSQGTAGAVRDSTFGGAVNVLTVQYEQEPLAGDLDGYAYGGRVQHWLNDGLRLGVTGMDEGTGKADQRAVEADIVMRHSEATYIEAELARARGPGFGRSRSVDGGLTLGDIADTGSDDLADALRLKARADLAELTSGQLQGTAGGYYESKQKGFSTFSTQTAMARRAWGAEADIDIGNDTNLALSYDHDSAGNGKVEREAVSDFGWQINERWKAALGLSYKERHSPSAIASGKSGYDGSRIDGGIRLDYRWNKDRMVYTFAQRSLRRDGDIRSNGRGGFGTEINLTDRVRFSGEISGGETGAGALASLSYDPRADTHYYTGYRLDPERADKQDSDPLDSHRGKFVAGLRRRIGDSAQAYTENSYDMFGRRNSLTHSYGVVYTPDNIWSIDLGFESGHIRDHNIDPATGLEREDFDRFAPSLAIAYKDEAEGIAAHIRGELRIESSEHGTRDQNTRLFTGGLNWQQSRDWRLLTHADVIVSDATAANKSFRGSDYVELSAGYAHRPVDNDRDNALFKYTWLYDQAEHGQSTDAAQDPAQRSHILSADLTRKIWPWLSLGGKYGLRHGKVEYRSEGYAGLAGDWQKSTAHLGILRADLHVVKKWDVLLEGRIMHMPEAETSDRGVLMALYRHAGNNFKAGVGFNFGAFSDDLRDLTFDDRGPFLNVVAKF